MSKSHKLWQACQDGRVEDVKALLRSGGVNLRYSNHQYYNKLPIHVATAPVLKVLVEHKADPNDRDPENNTPLHDAAYFDRVDVARKLIQLGANVRAKNKFGWTPLHSCTLKASPDMARLLLQSRAQLSDVNNDTNIALHDAAWNGNHAVARVLLQYGANPNYPNKDQWTPLMSAGRSTAEGPDSRRRMVDLLNKAPVIRREFQAQLQKGREKAQATQRREALQRQQQQQQAQQKRQQQQLQQQQRQKQHQQQQQQQQSNVPLTTGFMHKRGGFIKNWKRRFFSVSPAGQMEYFEDSSKTSKKGSFSVASAEVNLVPFSKFSRKCCFSVKTTGRTWFMSAPTQQDLRKWLRAVQRCNAVLHANAKQLLTSAAPLRKGSKPTDFYEKKQAIPNAQSSRAAAPQAKPRTPASLPFGTISENEVAVPCHRTVCSAAKRLVDKRVTAAGGPDNVKPSLSQRALAKSMAQHMSMGMSGLSQAFASVMGQHGLALHIDDESKDPDDENSASDAEAGSTTVEESQAAEANKVYKSAYVQPDIKATTDSQSAAKADVLTGPGTYKDDYTEVPALSGAGTYNDDYIDAVVDNTVNESQAKQQQQAVSAESLLAALDGQVLVRSGVCKSTVEMAQDDIQARSVATMLKSRLGLFLLQHAGGKPFNTQLQQILFDAGDCKKTSEFHARSAKAEHVIQKFNYFAQGIAEMLIDQEYLPARHKVIPPEDVGGKAGGEKFIVAGVLFKMARDWRGIYKSEYAAGKAASLEIRALNAVIDQALPALSVTLSAVVYCRGRVVFATALAPLAAPHSLVYGSADAGHHIQDASELPGVRRLMRQLALRLHLRPHHVVEKSSGKSKSLCLPVDIELHCGTDARLYLLDLARLCPPSLRMFPDTFYHFLIHHYRPELLHIARLRGVEAVSSDALSQFGAEDAAKENARARALQPVLVQQIQALAEHLVNEVEQSAARLTLLTHPGDLFHEYGVNMRFLPHVMIALKHIADKTPNLASAAEAIQGRLVSHIIARLLKRAIRSHWRDHSWKAEMALRAAVLTIRVAFAPANVKSKKQRKLFQALRLMCAAIYGRTVAQQVVPQALHAPSALAYLLPSLGMYISDPMKLVRSFPDHPVDGDDFPYIPVNSMDSGDSKQSLSAMFDGEILIINHVVKGMHTPGKLQHFVRPLQRIKEDVATMRRLYGSKTRRAIPFLLQQLQYHQLQACDGLGLAGVSQGNTVLQQLRVLDKDEVIVGLWSVAARFHQATGNARALLDVFAQYVSEPRPPPTDFALGLIANSMAGSLENSLSPKEVLPYFFLALDHAKVVFGDHVNTAGVHKNCARTAARCGLVDVALEHYDFALNLFKKECGADSLEYGYCLMDSSTLLMDRDPEKGLKQAMTVRDILRAKLGPHHPETAVVMSNVGAMCHRMGRHQEAIVPFKQALEALSKSPQNPNRPLIMKDLAAALRKCGKITEAVQQLEEASQLLRASQGLNAASTGSAMWETAMACIDLGDLAKAATYLEYVLQSETARLGPHDEDTMATATKLRQVRAALAQRKY